MKLTLQNGYPYPFPAGLTEQENNEITANASSERITLEGVRHVEWLYAFTVAFESEEAFELARQKTGWQVYGDLTLEANTSSADGYDQPAIIAAGMAYCGLVVKS